MRPSRYIFLLLLGLALSGEPRLAGDDKKPDKQGAPARIDQLISQLGSKSFKERDAATKALGAIGSPALAALRKATRHDDAEVRRRAGRRTRSGKTGAAGDERRGVAGVNAPSGLS